MDIVDHLTWLLDGNLPAGLHERLAGLSLTLASHVGGVSHLAGACSRAEGLPRRGEVTLGDYLGLPALCSQCLVVHLGTLTPAHTGAGAVRVLRSLPGYADAMMRSDAAIHALATDPQAVGFTDVPWDVHRGTVTRPGDEALAAAADTLRSRHLEAVTRLREQVAATHPHWPLVAYAVQSNPDLIGERLARRLVSGAHLRLRRDARDRLERVVASLDHLADPRPVALLVRRRAGTSLTHHPLVPLEQAGDVDVLALPAPLAGSADRGSSLPTTVLDPGPGWVDQPAVRDRVRTTALLWAGDPGGLYGDVEVAWQAAAALRD